VIWERIGNVRAFEYNIYSEGSTTGQYNLIGTNTVSQFSTYLDAGSNPLQQSYSYKLAEVDSCGSELPLSAYHKTIHLAANVGVNGEVNLSWNQYEGRPYSTHNIMRSFNGGPFTLLNQVSSTITSYSDLTPPIGAKVYRIDADLTTSCSPSKTTAYNLISSNQVDLTLSAIDETLTARIRMVPNPTTGVISIEGTDPSVIRLYDIIGKLLIEKKEADKIDLSELPSGVYLIKLYNKAGHVYYQQKLVRK
jgi:hypothetical protein